MNLNPFHLKIAANLSRSWGPPLYIFGLQEKGERMVRERLLVGLGLVGAAMVFSAIAVGRSGSRSTPCSTCGRIEDLALVDPIGTHLIRGILWDCRCGNTRVALINRYTPSALIEKAIARDLGLEQP
jgi:hypothetical protein